MQHHIRSRPLRCLGACFAPCQRHYSSGSLNQAAHVKAVELQTRERRISAHWANLEHQKNTTEHIGEKLGVKQIMREGGKPLFSFYSSVEELLRALYPEYQWETAYFAVPPRQHKKLAAGFWADIHNQRQLLDGIGLELGIKKPEDWLKVSRDQVNNSGGQTLFRYYKSLRAVLWAIYPDLRISLPCAVEPRAYWKKLDNQRERLTQIGKQLGVKQLSDWYGFTLTDVVKRGGAFMKVYYRSLEEAMKTLYPTYPWYSNFSGKDLAAHSLAYFWRNTDNQREFLDSVAKELGIKKLSDWLRVSRSQIIKRGGRGLFRYYDSLEDALRKVYPTFDWEAAQDGPKEKPVHQCWRDENIVGETLDIAEQKIGIKKPEDWYSVSVADLREVGLPRVDRRTLANLLAQRYPSFKWDLITLLRGKYAEQKRLESAVRSLFPEVEIKANTRKESGLINPETGDYLELDIFLPALRLAFEYQERHHYLGLGMASEHQDDYKRRDDLKQKVAREAGITLITVPFWWDRSKASLIATIKKERPELLGDDVSSKGGHVIPIDPPPNLLEKHQHNIEGVGQPMTASFLTHSSVDPTNWWVFEKYDGVRGFWNPVQRTFFSRQGRPFEFPEEILSKMPSDIFLDGELWFGRNTYDEAMKLVQRKEGVSIDWSKFKYMVFDAPNHGGTYKDRYTLLRNRVGEDASGVIEVAQMQVCEDVEHLERVFQDILNKGGEGIILRDPACMYTGGRSHGYLKHKKFRDVEARVVAHIGGNEWECELPNGVRFNAVPATMDFVKRKVLKTGDIVSIKHRGFLSGTMKPKFPAIYRIRTDVLWQDLVDSWQEDKPHALSAAPPLRRTPTRRADLKPKRYWSVLANRQSFLEQIAREAGIDPMNALDWKNVSLQFITSKKGGGLLAHYNSNLRLALEDTFPDLRFDNVLSYKRKGKPHRYWHDLENRRKFFCDFAQEHQFDPSQSFNWEYVTISSVMKKGSGLLASYSYNLKRALEDTFPELDFSGVSVPKKDKRDIRRQSFIEIAQQMDFDPLDWDKWKTVQPTHLKGKVRLRGSLEATLRDTFPEFQDKEAFVSQ